MRGKDRYRLWPKFQQSYLSSLELVRFKDIEHCTGIMKRRLIEPLYPEISLFEADYHIHQNRTQCTFFQTHSLPNRLTTECSMSHLQRNHDHPQPRCHYHLGSQRIKVDIELCCRGHIPHPHSPAHKAKILDTILQFRGDFQKSGEIRECPCANEYYFVLVPHYLLKNQFERVIDVCQNLGREELDSPQPQLPMRVHPQNRPFGQG